MDEVNTTTSARALRKFATFASAKFVPDESPYMDAMAGIDYRPQFAEVINKSVEVDLTKAQTISGLASGTQDLTLIPIYVDPTIVDLTRRKTPLVELVPRVTNYGRTAEYNRLTARGVSPWSVEDAAMLEADDTYARRSAGVKFLRQVGRVTGPMLAASRQYLSQQYIDALNLEVRNKTTTWRYVEEDTIINGDSATSRTMYGSIATTAANEFDGYLTGNTGDSTDVWNGINADAMGGGSEGISNLRQIIRKARTANESASLGQGDPNLMVTDFKTLDDIKGLLQDFQRYVNTNYTIGWGLKTLEFEGLPVIPSKFHPTTAAARALAVLSTETLQMRVLQDLTYEELAKTNDSYKFMVKGYETFICTAPEFNGKQTGLA